MPGNYRHRFNAGLRAMSHLHTARYDLDRLTLHAMDLERTLYRLASTILLDKIVDLDAERGLAVPSAEARTYLGDYWTQAQLYAALTHAVELTGHVCPSCEGQGGDCVSCNGAGEIAERVTNEDRIRALLAGEPCGPHAEHPTEHRYGPSEGTRASGGLKPEDVR